jgi:hypothetical protein
LVHAAAGSAARDRSMLFCFKIRALGKRLWVLILKSLLLIPEEIKREVVRCSAYRR